MELLKKNRGIVIAFVALLISGLLRIQNLWLPIGIDMHAFRQTETAIVIQNYFNDGWSLFHYEMPVLGHPWQIPFEFPIYQSVVYFAMKIFHKTNIDVWCRLVSLCSFYLSSFVLKKIADFFVDKRSAYCIWILYLFAPFTILWSRAALIDYMSVLFALVYVWGLYSWLVKGCRTFVFTFLFGILAYLLKATTMFSYVFFLTYLIIDYFVKQIRKQYGKITIDAISQYVMENKTRIMLLALLCVLPVIPGMCWTKYADMVKVQSVYTRGLASEALHSWNYGTIEQKIQISNWKVIVKRLVYYMGGKEIVFCMGLAYLWFGKKRNLHIIINCAISIFLTVFLLFNLYCVHDYYMIALTPLLSIAYGTVLFVIIDKLLSRGKVGKIGISIILLFIVIMQIATNKEYLRYALFPNYGMEQSGAYLTAITTPDERIVIEGEDWNPATLYYADRKGLMLTSYKQASDELFTDFLQQENYTTLVAHSLKFVDIWAKHYSVLMQYPKSEGKYIYKFYEQLPESLNTKEAGISIIRIRYDALEESVEIDAELTDSNGNKFYDSIALLTNREEIYYNVGAVWQDIQSVSFETPDNMKILIEY